MTLFVDPRTFYDAEYWLSAKKYHTPDGEQHVYISPAVGGWHGFQYIAEAIAPLLPPREGGHRKTLLDIGCGGGDLAGRLMDLGYSSYGCDISEFALENSVDPMRGRLALADVTTCPERLEPFRGQMGEWPDRVGEFPGQFDIIISSDFLEHVFLSDLEATFNWLLARCKRWLFFCVATAGSPDKTEFVHEKGKPVPLEWEATAISGHVNVRRWEWWVAFFESKGLRVDWQKGYLFQMLRERNPPWRDTMGWNMETTWFLEKR